jgi:transcriptional regulator with XRE-family HTH domain
MTAVMESSLKSRVKARMDALEMNAFNTAKKAKLGNSYVRDILRGKTTQPLAENLAKLAEALETTPDYLMGRSDDSTLRPVKAKVEGVPVIGKVSASTWYAVDDEFIEEIDEDTERVPSVSGYPLEWQFGMIVEGNCLNKVARNGDRLVCLDLIKSQVEIQDDDLVVIERRRFSGQMRSITAKRVKRTKRGFELWPESDDPAHQEPIPITKPPEGEEIRIWAKVLWVLRRP